MNELNTPAGITNEVESVERAVWNGLAKETRLIHDRDSHFKKILKEVDVDYMEEM